MLVIQNSRSMDCFKVFLLSLMMLAVTFSYSCDNPDGKSGNSDTTQPPPPPPLPYEEQKLCDSLKRFAYETLNQGNRILIYNDTITDNARHLKFVQVLKEKFHFDYYRTYDIDNYETRSFKFCVQPIMDSFIASKYGIGAKDSIINAAYLMVE